MITLRTGENRLVFPLSDFPEELPAAFALKLENRVTKRITWCQLQDSQQLVDWLDFPVEVVGSGADPLQSQLALTAKDRGDHLLTIYGGTAYSNSPPELTLLRQERCAF